MSNIIFFIFTVNCGLCLFLIVVQFNIRIIKVIKIRIYPIYWVAGNVYEAHFWAVNNSRNTDLLKKFGANLKRLRESQGMSQEELCFKSGLSKNQIGNIERGEVNTTISSISAISNAMNLSIQELFEFDN